MEFENPVYFDQRQMAEIKRLRLEAFTQGYKDGWSDAGYSPDYRPDELFEAWLAERNDDDA